MKLLRLACAAAAMGLIPSAVSAADPAAPGVAAPAASGPAVPAAPAAPVESARIVDPWQVLAALRTDAEKGNNEAIFRIGKAFADAGQYTEAETWLKRAAENNYVTAQMALARLYFMTARGDQEKEKTAAAWIMRAADSGDAGAQVALALLYKNGMGVEQDYKKALALLEKLAQAGHPDAQRNLGLMYYGGLGVERDDARAAALLTLSVQGYKEGPTRDRILQELQEIKSGMTINELSQAKALYAQAVMYFRGLQQTGQSGDLARPELPSAQGIQPKEREALKAYDWSGFVQGGISWQDNANGAPPLKSGSLSRPQPDSNLFAMASLSLISPPHGPRLESLDTRATVYQTRQHDEENSNTAFAELSSGPNINLTADGRYAVRPYLTLSATQVDRTLYQVAGGGGANFVASVTRDSAIVLNLEDVYIDFDQSAEFPGSNASDGTQLAVSARGMKRAAPWLTVDLGVTWRNVEAKKDWRSQDSVRISNGYAFRLPPLKPEWSPRPASLYASASCKRSWYEVPDPGSIPGIRRTNDEWQAMLTGEFPLVKDWSAVPTVQKTWRTGNHPLYESSSTTASLVLMYKF